MKRIGMKRVLAVLAGGVLLLMASRSQDGPWRTRAPHSVWDSVYTEAQAMRGDSVYVQACTDCHGPTLAGADDAPPLAGKDFIAGWGGHTVGALSSRIRRTMPQDNSIIMTRQQISDVVAYILYYNKFPAGKTELGLDETAMEQIQIDAARPQADSTVKHDSLGGHQ